MLVRGLCLLTLICCQAFNEFAQVSEKGYIDLRTSDFDAVFPLEGEWEFYWNQLLSSEEIDTLSMKGLFKIPPSMEWCHYFEWSTHSS